ncbi:exported hypothetical protein [Acidobacteriia bacterium SbA2]|nr:exported hypothetical protein [Acidobacteriia bacterium SbA2]
MLIASGIAAVVMAFRVCANVQYRAAASGLWRAVRDAYRFTQDDIIQRAPHDLGWLHSRGRDIVTV